MFYSVRWSTRRCVSRWSWDSCGGARRATWPGQWHGAWFSPRWRSH